MKKTWIILLILAMVLVVAAVGCGEDDSPDGDAPDSGPVINDADDGEENFRTESDEAGINLDDLKLNLNDLEMPDDEALFKGQSVDFNSGNWESTDD